MPILVWLASGALIIGQLDTICWIFELFSHFTSLYVLLFFLFCFCSLSEKQCLLFAAITVVGGYWYFSVVGLLIQPNTPQSKSVLFLSYSVLNINEHIDTESK